MVRGTTPKRLESIRKILQELPINSHTVFYDGERKYHTGKPPYLFIVKELSNVIKGQVTYRSGDNRGFHPVVIREEDMGPFPNEVAREKDPSLPSGEHERTSLVGAIWNQSNLYSHILNTYLTKWQKKPESQMPSGITQPQLRPDFDQLKRIRQIKYQKAKKRRKEERLLLHPKNHHSFLKIKKAINKMLTASSSWFLKIFYLFVLVVVIDDKLINGIAPPPATNGNIPFHLSNAILCKTCGLFLKDSPMRSLVSA